MHLGKILSKVLLYPSYGMYPEKGKLLRMKILMDSEVIVKVISLEDSEILFS